MRLTPLLIAAIWLAAACGTDDPAASTDSVASDTASDVAGTTTPPVDSSVTQDADADVAADTSAAADADDTADTNASADTDAADADAPAPNVRQHLASECPIVPSTLRFSPPAGDALDRVTLPAEGAVCNDGSPAIMYVRRAADQANRDRWLFHLQGGGGCGDYTGCRDRWCGNHPIYDAAKMSSRWAPSTMGERGIFRRVAANTFGAYNHVFVYYCSSDGWRGRRNDAPVSDSSGATPMTMHMRGHDIVKAALTALDAGAESDVGAVTLPSLRDAERIVWTGSSAGSGGATHHLDWVATRYPEAQVIGVFDAGISPHGDDLGPEFRDAYAEVLQVHANQSFAMSDAFIDESCDAHFSGPTADQRWRCGDSAYLKTNHLTTPFFQRLDLRDRVGSGTMESLGATLAEIAEAARLVLLSLAQAPDDAVEASALTRTPGAYGPNCGQHIALVDDAWFAQATVEDASSTPTTFHDAVTRWLGGETIVIVDEDPRERSVCGETTDDR